MASVIEKPTLLSTDSYQDAKWLRDLVAGLGGTVETRSEYFRACHQRWIAVYAGADEALDRHVIRQGTIAVER